MSINKSIRLLSFASTFLLVSTGSVSARLVRHWSYQELLDKSDLVAIATPRATNDTEEHINLPGLAAQRVVGVETEFAVSVVLKGDKALKKFSLHHYRAEGAMVVRNGPTLVSFAPGEKTFIAFLVREADGRYAPTVGQVHPGMQGIHVLGGAGK
ncbi:MAG: hypothetical protein O3C40_31300 [Planctomycetota bacterium]|nr:hypothetical protein [Planctomycetota bacterium]